ncbi:alpha/beta hydrolase [Novosphingobium capsulatum]|uniref:alpha/beta hydrolase n=1 Tax=Novosphingobium capsulatum TaxID=13688 RepID=UPI0007875BB7|nr:alpha/beta hydrolase [Novosphingobium capsulatum]WQD95289.1 alpha/beta hydrolase [Novosphingobium capsulatum]
MDHAINRRGMLGLLGGAMMAGSFADAAAGHARAPLQTPIGASALPPAWQVAEAVPLWQGRVAPGGTFHPVARAADLAATFVTDVAAPELRVFRPQHGNGRALLVIPGGAYTFVSVRNEGVDVAARFTALGYTVFVLVYRLPGEGWTPRADVPLADAQRAMRQIRALAGTHGFDPAQVAAIGFSAGGHLAASLLTGYDEALFAPGDAIDRLDARPACGVLVYPVIAMEPPYTHAYSCSRLLGDHPDAALIARRSPARHVGAQTPPVMLAHSFDDPAVPWQNSTLFIEAMQAAHRPVEAHFFEEGGHGFGTGPANAPAGQWTNLAASWLDRQLG